MNNIKGLLVKDILQLKSYKKTLIFFIIIFILTSISNDGRIGSALIIMLTLGFGMFSIASFSYDETNKADKFILTLPLTKKEVVLSKYILIISSTVIGSIIGIILSCIFSIILSKQIPNIFEILSVALGGILVIGFIESVQIPCIYKWGAEKGRIQMMILSALVALLAGVISFAVEKANIQLQSNNIIEIINQYLPLIFIVLTIIIYYISYRVSYKIYDRKEL